jgi:DnaK suppressor protein
VVSEATLSNVRAQLQDERAHLQEQLQELGINDEALDYDDNFADSAQVAAEQGEARAHAASLRDQLKDVEAALAKIEDGTYGTCESCQGPIGEARLAAIPTARVCIQCAS